MGGFVPGHMTVMAQFIFTAASFSLEGCQDRACLQHTSMSSPGGVKHQGTPGCQVMRPLSAPYRGIWDPL